MKVTIIAGKDGASVEVSYKEKRNPNTVVEYFGDIKVDEEKLLQALDSAKEAIGGD